MEASGGNKLVASGRENADAWARNTAKKYGISEKEASDWMGR